MLMTSMRRRSAVGALLALMLTTTADPAFGAGGPVVVSGGVAGAVNTTIHAPGRPGGPSGGRAPNGAQAVNTGGGGPVCTYAATSVMTVPGSTTVTPVGSGGLNENAGSGLAGDSTQGQFMNRSCGGQVTVVWVPTGPGGAPIAVPVVTPEMLAQDARNMLQLPVPDAQTNSAIRDGSIVNFPTWWWVTNGQPMNQRTALGAVWAEVTATPVTSTWYPEDGLSDPVTCTGMGFPYVDGMGEDYPGHCGVTYEWSSVSARAGSDQAFDSQVRVTWRITWVGSGGTGGTLDPLTMDGDHPMKVYERQAVNVPNS